MNAILDSASENGVNWIVFLLGIWLLKALLDKQYKSWREDQSRVHGFFEHAGELLDRFSNSILANQNTIMVMVKETSKASDDIILEAIRDMNTASNEATGAIILTLGIKENRTVEAIEGLIRALHEELAASRAAPPPVGGTGSQVRGTP